MAPPKNKPAKPGRLSTWIATTFTVDYAKKLLFDAHYIAPTCLILFLLEIVVNIIIIERFQYTEIDWKAYMQEVEGFLNGTRDYSLLKGDTGPLVYPAGFVYIFSAFYYITDQGTNIHRAQYIYLALYLLQIALFYRILMKTLKIPPYALVLATVTSYRIHSIFVLRLFNDPVAVLLFYVALNFWISNHWKWGSLFYSLAVSVKMNILLYAPALLLAYLRNLNYQQVFINLLICGSVQVLLGMPFMCVNLWAYICGSFNFGRVFLHEWTVNYRFLPVDLFENRVFHATLLIIHLLMLACFAPIFKRYFESYWTVNMATRLARDQIQVERKRRLAEKSDINNQLLDLNYVSKTTQLLVLPFFVVNLIGITCARSLHYQFYSWYFHSLLYIGFSTGYSRPAVFLQLGVMELCWNTYPSTWLSSGMLHICHLTLLYGVYRTMKSSVTVAAPKKENQD